MEPPAAAPTAAARAQIDESQEHDDEISFHPHQVGGHAGLTNEGGALLVAEPGRLAKPVGHGYFAGEDAFYEQLRPDDALSPFVPAFFGTRCIRGRTCVVLEDVTHGMRAPIVDIQRRVRTAEDELQLMRREHIDPRGGHDLAKPAEEGVARPAHLRVETIMRDEEDVLEPVGQRDGDILAIRLESDLTPALGGAGSR